MDPSTPTGALLLAFTQAGLAEEQYHADFLEKNGAKPLTDTFTVPDPKILTDAVTFFSTIETAETLLVGAYMAATREFSAMGNRTLAQYAYQIGSVEAEHRVLARAALALAGQGHIPPNNLAFEMDVVFYIKDAAKMLTDLGFIGGKGTPAQYPGRAAALAAAGAQAARWLNSHGDISAAVGKDGRTVDVRFADGSRLVILAAERAQGRTPGRGLLVRRAPMSAASARALVLEPFVDELGRGADAGGQEADRRVHRLPLLR